jgi:serine protease inhibitor
MTDGDATFAAHLYDQLRGHAGNLFFSPASIRIALAMAWAGARADTATEMQHALVLPAPKEAHAQFAALLRGWDALAHPSDNSAAAARDPQMQKYYEEQLERRRIVLRVVNRLWAQSGYKLRDDFLALLRDSYRAPAGLLDFHKSPEPSRAAINKWVSVETEKKIPELIARGLITADTRLVLTNAVYFKAHWQEPFEKSATRDEPFFADGGKKVTVPLMHNVHYFSLAAFDGGQMLELPYASGELVMDVVLPAKQDGLGRVEKQFAGGALRGWLAALKPMRVDVTLPRFKTSSSFSLSETLGALGMKKAFSYPGADFSGMDDGHDLFISAVVHQAVVDVDEHGTEAAAATAVMMAAGAAPPTEPPALFRADHPFLFLIRDTKSGVVLFVGRLVAP